VLTEVFQVSSVSAGECQTDNYSLLRNQYLFTRCHGPISCMQLRGQGVLQLATPFFKHTALGQTRNVCEGTQFWQRNEAGTNTPRMEVRYDLPVQTVGCRSEFTVITCRNCNTSTASRAPTSYTGGPGFKSRPVS